jgi:hypothetical protein
MLVSIAKKHFGEENGKIKNGFYRSEISSHKIKEHAFGLTLKRAGDEGGKQVQLHQCLSYMEQSIIKKDMN